MSPRSAALATGRAGRATGRAARRPPAPGDAGHGVQVEHTVQPREVHLDAVSDAEAAKECPGPTGRSTRPSAAARRRRDALALSAGCSRRAGRHAAGPTSRTSRWSRRDRVNDVLAQPERPCAHQRDPYEGDDASSANEAAGHRPAPRPRQRQPDRRGCPPARAARLRWRPTGVLVARTATTATAGRSAWQAPPGSRPTWRRHPVRRGQDGAAAGRDHQGGAQQRDLDGVTFQRGRDDG